MTTNHAFITRGRFRVLAPEARAYKVEVEKIVRALNEKPPKGQLRVHIRFYSTRWFNLDGSVKRRDVSNLEKLCVDAIFAALEIDDSNIFSLTLEKCVADYDRTEVMLEKLEVQ